MRDQHELAALVQAAKESADAADRLISRYLPFIKSETAKFIHRFPQEGHDDELSIAMFAFHESAMAYQPGKGAFLPFASRAIKNRLIDYARQEQRHAGVISYDQPDEDDQTLLDKLHTGRDEAGEHDDRTAAKAEILEFSQTLAEYGLTLSDIADNCPKQERTLAACHKALGHARSDPSLLKELTAAKKLPLSKLVSGAGVERKTLERHRKYMMAILLAYTNGFEIIRGHLSQVARTKGGRN